MVEDPPRQLCPRETYPVAIVQEDGWVPGPVRTDAENLATTGIQSPDRPARSESLYRLRYPVHISKYCQVEELVEVYRYSPTSSWCEQEKRYLLFFTFLYSLRGFTQLFLSLCLATFFNLTRMQRQMGVC